MTSTANSRRGWTLLEMMVVITLMSLLLSASAVLITTLLRYQGVLWAEIQQQSAQARLAVQLRADAHAASSAKSVSPQVCEFLGDGGGLVHYEFKESRLHREVRKSDTVLERAVFSLPGQTAAFSLDESQERPLVRLSLNTAPDDMKHRLSSRPSVLEAALGIHKPPPARREP